MKLKQINSLICIKGKTVADICEALGISRGAYYARFRRNSWSLKEAEQLCKILDASEKERDLIFFG